MLQLQHRFVAEILREGSKPLTTLLDLDWVPAVEWSRFQRIRSNSLARAAWPDRPYIRPAWDRATGAPYVSHVEIGFGREEESGDAIPRQFFAGSVAQVVSGLVKEGQIEAGEKYHWKICAYPGGQQTATPDEDDFSIDEERQCTDDTLEPMVLRALIACAQYHGPKPSDGEPRDVAVVFSPQVLREASETATAAGAFEAGGILLGRLGRDDAIGDVALEVSAQITAREAIADDASLRFTPQTWQAVDAAIRLRGGREKILGWWHSHPPALWACKNCSPERREACPSNRPFFSAMDVGFHRTAFQTAHNIALLLSFHAGPGPLFDLFGWRQGIVSPRGYYIKEMDNDRQ